MIQAATQGDHAPFHHLLAAVTHPREDREAWADLALAPTPDEVVRQTFCGT